MPGSTSAANLPNVTGFYRFNFVQPTPRNPKLGWIVGLGGRKGPKGVDAEFIVAPKGYPEVHSRHLRIVLSQSNVLLAVSDPYEFQVDGNQLRRRVLDRTIPMST
ncbi:unnamed protein product [Zymoseptoria tritici ST99CH_3D1]|uniref:Uncharacterized protein n=1 Tax=Zymoseptoria tritici ST99CH_1E4 TaxID=1276532 RepID=A0A2H1H961_ZYMTR|nr:unnamed protein product [Zymoseptoria tritici ST99CH_1E4]SMR64745.1 unnamed protein product [Zymoseptoria tritici ST99CH_3D1]